MDSTPSDSSLWTFYAYTKPSTLTQFNLDFPGGTPAQLIKAIEKATTKPLNVVINKEDENVELPPLKMNNVYLPQLFTASGSRQPENRGRIHFVWQSRGIQLLFTIHRRLWFQNGGWAAVG